MQSFHKYLAHANTTCTFSRKRHGYEAIGLGYLMLGHLRLGLFCNPPPLLFIYLLFLLLMVSNIILQKCTFTLYPPFSPMRANLALYHPSLRLLHSYYTCYMVFYCMWYYGPSNNNLYHKLTFIQSESPTSKEVRLIDSCLSRDKPVTQVPKNYLFT